MTGMSVSKRVCLLALLVFLPCAFGPCGFGPWAFGQSSGDRSVRSLRHCVPGISVRRFNSCSRRCSSPRRTRNCGPCRGSRFRARTRRRRPWLRFAARSKSLPTIFRLWKARPNWNTRRAAMPRFRSLQHVLKLLPSDPTSHAMLAVLFVKRRRLRIRGPTFRAERAAAGFSTRRAATVWRLPGQIEAVGQSDLRLQPAGWPWTRPTVKRPPLSGDRPTDGGTPQGRDRNPGPLLQAGDPNSGHCNWPRLPMKPVAILRKRAVAPPGYYFRSPQC